MIDRKKNKKIFQKKSAKKQKHIKKYAYYFGERRRPPSKSKPWKNLTLPRHKYWDKNTIAF